MAGMYPDNQKITMNGEELQWPGLGADGKFTNGDFNDPVACPPSFIPAETINLILDNMASLVTSLGGKPNNRDTNQLGIVRTYIDELKTAIEGSIASNTSSIADHTGNKSNPHGVTKAQVGLGNVENTAQVTNVAWSSNKLTKTINGSVTDIVTAATLKSALGVTSGGHQVAASSYGANSGYIKYTDGLIIQWGYVYAKSATLPISFSNSNFIVVDNIADDAAEVGAWDFFYPVSPNRLTVHMDSLGPHRYIAIGK